MQDLCSPQGWGRGERFFNYVLLILSQPASLGFPCILRWCFHLSPVKQSLLAWEVGFPSCRSLHQSQSVAYLTFIIKILYPFFLLLLLKKRSMYFWGGGDLWGSAYLITTITRCSHFKHLISFPLASWTSVVHLYRYKRRYCIGMTSRERTGSSGSDFLQDVPAVLGKLK